MVTRSGWSKLTNAYQSVISAVRSRAVIGASRWLDANSPDGASTNRAKAKAARGFRFFIVFPLGERSLGVATRSPPPRPGPHATSSYEWLRPLLHVREAGGIG